MSPPRSLIPSVLVLVMVHVALWVDPIRATPTAESRIALHLTSVTSKAACTRAASAPACAQTVTAGDLLPATYFAYLLVQNGDPAAGISGLQCGIRYQGAPQAGVDIFSWTSCATLEFPSGGWPASNTGTLITWDTTTRCQRSEPGGPGTGVVATAGYFYLAAYSPDVLEVIPRPADGLARVADCSNVEYTLAGGGVQHDPSYLGTAVFSPGATTSGHNPCTAPSSPPVHCAISGPAIVLAGTPNHAYGALEAPEDATFSWSITGDGRIHGATTGRHISVDTGSPGSFDLTVAVTHQGDVQTCAMTVSVVGTPSSTCAISGPSLVPAQTAGHVYSVAIDGPFQPRDWSITGDGTIVGGTTGLSVSVTAGALGAFELTCSLRLGGGAYATCTHAVTVGDADCTISGPDAVPAHSAETAFTAGSVPVGSTLLWSISGEGAISGPATESTVLVNAGGPGAFTLSLTHTLGGVEQECSRVVTVEPLRGGANTEARLALHALPATPLAGCTRDGTSPACHEVVCDQLSLYPDLHFMYLLVSAGNTAGGVGGLQCSIEYDPGVRVLDWQLCADLEFPVLNWPLNQSGNRIYWNPDSNCQRFVPAGNEPENGVVAVAGYFYTAAYSPGLFRIRPLSEDNRATVTDCAGRETLLAGEGAPVGGYTRLGIAAFGRSGGFNPCAAPLPARVTSWSAIKAQFGEPNSGRTTPH